MTPALLLVDLQNDYLDRPDLIPSAAELTQRCASLLAGCREHGLPIIHARTVVDPDGDNRMPHWKRDDHWSCVAGTRGCEPPPGLEAIGGEPVIAKPFFSAFSAPTLEPHLRTAAVDTLILSGAYLHACVQATALDAYQRGLEVWIAADAVATYTPSQAAVATEFLNTRAARFLPTEEILNRLS